MKVGQIKNYTNRVIYFSGSNFFNTSELIQHNHCLYVGDFYNNIMKCFSNDISWYYTTNERKRMFDL
jgi:hypothetical protein